MAQVCAAPWPCPVARLNPHDGPYPAALFARFLGWLDHGTYPDQGRLRQGGAGQDGGQGWVIRSRSNVSSSWVSVSLPESTWPREMTTSRIEVCLASASLAIDAASSYPR